MIDKSMLEAMALRGEIYDNLNRLRGELEKVKESGDPKEQEKGRFFEELGLRFYASLEAGLDPAIAGIAATHWIEKDGCGDEECQHCNSPEASNEGLDSLLEIMESANEAGSPLFLLPGDDTIH
jgi:hypothetical protein